MNQNDANFMAGIEVGFRCAEKGMNLQAAIEYGKKVLKEFPMTLDDAPRVKPAASNILCSAEGCTRLASFIINSRALCEVHRNAK